jgi:hypothetical protein
LDQHQSVFQFVGIFEHPSFRRTRGTRAVTIIRAAMTRAKEQAGLRKPANRATEVGAVDCENLKLICFDMPDPARGIGSLAVRWTNERISERCETGFPLRELIG